MSDDKENIDSEVEKFTKVSALEQPDSGKEESVVAYPLGRKRQHGRLCFFLTCLGIFSMVLCFSSQLSILSSLLIVFLCLFS